MAARWLCGGGGGGGGGVGGDDEFTGTPEAGGRVSSLHIYTHTGKVRPRYRFDLYGAPLNATRRRPRHRLPTLRRRERYYSRQVNTAAACVAHSF